ncbi:hypothetical protein BsWGS_27587 [Bradybaena similaris]
MGNSNRNLAVNVYTGDKKSAGTDATVFIVLHDDKNNTTPPITLNNTLRNDFERGNVDTFSVPIRITSFLSQPIKIKRIEIWQDGSGLDSNWFVDRIEIENKATGETFVFPVFRWIKANVHYQIGLLDTSLPQFDEFPDQRKRVLEEKRAAYQLAQKLPNGPVQVAKIPDDEVFSFDYKWDIVKRGLIFKVHRQLHLATHPLNFPSIQDMFSLYDSDLYNTPTATDAWDSDARFGMQRLVGLNHSMVALVKEIPGKFRVTDEHVKPFLEGSTIQEAINNKKLFICDHSLLEGIPTKEGFVVCAPMCLFYLDSNNKFKPVAMQLYQKPGPDNPIFTPACQKSTWDLAKLWFNNADTAYHQSLTHLGFTHLLMEGATLTSHRHLSVSHPLFKLLAPHFLYVVAINDRAVSKLIAPGEWVDQIMNCAVVGMAEIIRRGINKWRLNVEGTLPEDLKQRGLEDPDILPIYHYRDDAMLIYNAMHKYVKSYVDLYYKNAEMLEADHEVQNWAQELVKERNGKDGGIGLLGVPGNGYITTNEQLTQILTSIIYQCSVAHAAANFPQYNEYGFPLKYPAMLRGKPPTDPKAVMTEQDLVDRLPNRDELLKTMSITTILSTKGTKSLGDFEVQYVFDPPALELVARFREELKEISKTIHERNKTRDYTYEYLDPEQIPNSISI